MNNTIEYKGYIGSVEFSEEDNLFFGKVMGIRSLISYEGENSTDLITDFHNAIEDYLEACKAEGREPEKAYKGSFNIRISPELHRQLVVCATSHQMSLNSFVENALRKSVSAS
ncbi:MAG: type II toxin-antitoxin system HicB family antitoxin [Dorea sp.]|nr:type II toxin-antitoxin system HicB family antitoxin [Dorea sp.]